METVVVAFEGEKNGRRLKELLESSGTAACLLCRSADQVKRLVRQQRLTAVVCGYKFPDGTATAKHADALRLALVVILVYAFKHLDDYFLVRDYQAEEFGFVGDEILRIFLSLELSLLLTLTPFNLPTALLCGSFLLVYGFNFSGCVVVCRHEIFGTDVLRVTEVLTEFFEHTQIVAPH